MLGPRQSRPYSRLAVQFDRSLGSKPRNKANRAYGPCFRERLKYRRSGGG
jgi:hypothetical protein